MKSEKRKEFDKFINILNQNPNQTFTFRTFLDIGSSIEMCINLCKEIINGQHEIYFAEYRLLLTKDSLTKSYLGFLERTQHDLISRRTKMVLERRRNSGQLLGRPPGVKNKKLKLDDNLEEIKKYLNMKLSKASIAKLVGCHPQTLYDYISLKGLE